jgi:UDP-N-acetyl-D-glucosamine dehydrogenase
MSVKNESLRVVVMGQGYVGLPLAKAAVESGMVVHGFEVNESRVRDLNQGKSHVDDISDAEIASMIAAGYKATNDPSAISGADIIVICVPTPLDSGGGPDLRFVSSASSTIGAYLKPGATVILESTTYPGTTEEEVLPILESQSGLVCGRDFQLAFSPERIDPGSKVWNIKNTPKLVGGVSPEATAIAVDFYERFVASVIRMSGTREAEAAKLLENTYRHVNIALVNEMARFCHDLDINIWEVIRGAETKPFGFQKFTPGPGVGGHCIPIDPSYLSFKVKQTLGYQFKFVELAQEINNSMPAYIVARIGDLLNKARKPLNGSKVLILGVTYKPDIADQRESPAVPIAKILQQKGAKLMFHDPKVTSWKLDTGDLGCVEDLDVALRDADITVLLQHHSYYDVDSIAQNSAVFFDTRGALRKLPDGASLL